MTKVEEYFDGFSESNRFIDGIDIQAEGPAKDSIVIKYFNEDDKVQELTYDELRYAIYSAAHSFNDIIDSSLTPSDHRLPHIPVGYLSSTSKDCVINYFGLMYLNATPLLLSPRNSLSSLVQLLEKSETRFLVYEAGCSELAHKCQKAIPGLNIIPKLILNADMVKICRPPKSSLKVQGAEGIVLIMHTSGSTSEPKLIHLSNRFFMTNMKRIQADRDVNYLLTGTQLLLAPVFHIFGVFAFLRIFYQKAAAVFPRDTAKVSAKALLDDYKISKSESIILLPFHLKQLINYCENISYDDGWGLMKGIETLIYAGAPLTNDLADKILERGIKLVNSYGSTETGNLASCVCSKKGENPKLMKLIKGIDFEIFERDGDTGQILFGPGEKMLATGLCKPGDEGYLTGDIIRIIKYDREDDVLEFEILGRNDDTIVHITGEKSNPIPIEEKLISHPLIKMCVVYGTGKINNCLIIQLDKEVAPKFDFHKILDTVHDLVDKVNMESPSYSRIDRSLIYFLPLDSDKTLPLTSKGVLMRSKVYELFKDEIDNIYSNYEAGV